MNQQVKNGNYNRPNQKWVCTAEDCACPGGPMPGGSCATRSPCQPVKNGDRWECNRPANRGGACDQGPGPYGECCHENQGCVPQRSLRAKRKIFVVSFLSLITGFLLLGIWGPNRNEFLAPGGLSSPHAQIWSGPDAENRCVACHSAGATDPIGWFVGLFGGGSHTTQPQYQKCLACHKEMIPAETALMAHNQTPENLAKLTERITNGAGRNSHRIFATPVNHSGELACANCHREHHGKDHDLAAMTDKQCQSCHANQFESFQHGHPEFRGYGQTPTGGLQFDHFSHQSKYFVEASQKFDCKSCHQGDSKLDVMTTVSFEVGCASCHEKKIDASLTQGMPVFRLPSIDVEWLKENGLDVGQWPEEAAGSFDGTLPPAMKVLLAGDPYAMKAMKILGHDFDLFDVDMDNRLHLVAVYQLALSIKRLLFDLGNEGQNGLTERFEKLVASRIPRPQLQRMVAGLSSDVFTQAQNRWFPDLADEQKQLLKPETFVPGSAVNMLPAHKVSPGRVLPANFVQSDDDEVLAENPLSKVYRPENKSKSPQKNSPGTRQSEIEFQSLPEIEPDQSRSQNIPTTKQAKPPAAPSKTGSQSKTKFKSGYQINGAKSVANPFFGRKKQNESQQSQKPTAPVKPAQDLLSPNPIPAKNQPENLAADKPKTSSSASQQKEPKASNSGKESQLPIVIDDNTFQVPAEKQANKQQDQPNKQDLILSENPIKKLLQADSGSAADKSTGDLPNSDVANSPPAKPDEKDQSKSEEDLSPLAPLNNLNEAQPKSDLVQESQSKNETREKDETHAKSGTKEDKGTEGTLADKSEVHPELKGWDPQKLDPDIRVSLGGWFRDDETMTVSYRQSGHADEMTRNWYDFVTSIKDDRFTEALIEFRQMAQSPTAPGQCGSCHQQHQLSDDIVSIQWKSNHAKTKVRGFTRFSHRPHLVQQGNNQCASCHELNPNASLIAQAGNNVSVPTGQSGFHPISKNNCVTCHNEQSKTQGCTQCHNYHVDHAADSKAALIDRILDNKK